MSVLGALYYVVFSTRQPLFDKQATRVNGQILKRLQEQLHYMTLCSGCFALKNQTRSACPLCSALLAETNGLSL